MLLKNLITAAMFVMLSSGGLAQASDTVMIKSLLHAQTEAWNKGDINTFMQTYWQSDSLLFIGSKGPTYGWQKTLDNYKKRYPDTIAMGKLDFTLLEVRLLSPDNAFVLGKWHLTRTIGNVGGFFTLLFRKIKGQWYIVADHTS